MSAVPYFMFFLARRLANIAMLWKRDSVADNGHWSRPVTDFIYHYFRKGTRPFRSLSVLPDEQAKSLMKDLFIPGSMLWQRFGNPEWYLSLRRQVESELYRQFRVAFQGNAMAILREVKQGKHLPGHFKYQGSVIEGEALGNSRFGDAVFSDLFNVHR